MESTSFSIPTGLGTAAKPHAVDTQGTVPVPIAFYSDINHHVDIDIQKI